MPRIPIPQHPEEISPEWLTRVLHRNQVIPGDVDVLGVTQSDPGRNASYAGFVSRLSITYSTTGAPGPATMIAKLPAPERIIRGLFQPLYRNEALFYRRLASSMPIPVPQSYAALMNRSCSRTLLLLEDLSPQATPGDHTAGCTIEQAEIAIMRLAQLHAHWWNSPEIQQTGWIGRHRATSGQSLALYTGAWLPFQVRLRSVTPAPTLSLIRSFWRYRTRILELERNRPISLQHGDFRLANLAFSSTDVYTFDWQIVRIGLPLFDVAWFMLTSLTTAQRQASEPALLDHYLNTLIENGAENYSRDDLIADYRLGLLMTIPQTTAIGGLLRMDDERRKDLEQLLHRFESARQDHELEALVWG